MNKKLIAIGLITLLIIIFGLKILKPKIKHVEKSIEVNTTPGKVWAQVNSINKFKTWMPYSSLSKATLTAYSGEDGKIGSSYTWNGLEDVGEGKITLTHIDTSLQTNPNIEQEYKINYKLETFSPKAFTAKMEINIESFNKNTSIVTWQMDYITPFSFKELFRFNAERNSRFEEDFINGLVNLKQICESKE